MFWRNTVKNFKKLLFVFLAFSFGLNALNAEAKSVESYLNKIKSAAGYCQTGTYATVGCSTCHAWQGEWKLGPFILKKASPQVNYVQSQTENLNAIVSMIESENDELTKISTIDEYLKNMKPNAEEPSTNNVFIKSFYDNSIKYLNKCRQIIENKDQVVNDDAIDHESTCVICYENPLQIIFSCGHLVCCKQCSNNLNPRGCPICRKAISFEVELGETDECLACENDSKNKAAYFGSKCHHLSFCEECFEFSENKTCPVLNCYVEENTMQKIFYP